MTWREFVRTHRRSLLAVDFFTVNGAAGTHGKHVFANFGGPQI